MAKGEFGMLYLCAGGGGGMIFSFDKSTSLEGGGVRKKPWDYQGGFKKMKGKNKEIIIAHPLDKLWMLPNYIIKLKPPEWNHGYVIRRQDFIEK